MHRKIIACVAALGLSVAAHSEVPEAIYQRLVNIGQIVDVSCTAKLYRPFMPVNDYDTWWPPGAAAPDPAKADLYPGVSIARDQSFGPHPKDLLDIFSSATGRARRPVFIYVSGGGGNKIEQQVREANAFYDNIGRWGVKNGFVVVTVQRHSTDRWDEGGRDIAAAVDWVVANIARYHGDGSRIVMASHSAGTLPTGVYVGHPERWPHGVRIKGMIYMSGLPIPSLVVPGDMPNFGPDGPQPGATCGSSTNMGSNDGAISGPSRQAEPAPMPTRRPAPGEGLSTEEKAARDNLPGFKKTRVKLMLVRAELDPGVKGDMTATDKAVSAALCSANGKSKKPEEGNCPVTLYAKRHSHVSEVFSFDTWDTTVSGPVLKFAKQVTR
jgi:hypothetical protein